MNNIELIGNIGKDPEIKTFESGARCMNFSVATTANFRPKDGTTPHTNWHNVVVWGKIIERIEGTLRKGSRVFVKGEMEVKSYIGKDGQKKYSYQIRADLVYQIQAFASDNSSNNGPPSGGEFEHERYD